MPPRKKSKGTSAVEPGPSSGEGRSVRRRTRGSLQDLPDFAVEIQLEVFSNLHPRDLLNLARTCKRFREFFLHRSNERLWTAARESVDDLPERPPFLSEPAFVNLLFSTHCHNCGKSNIRKVIWRWFARYCPSCMTLMSYHFYEVNDKIYNTIVNVHAMSEYKPDDLFGMHVSRSNYVRRTIHEFTSKYFRFHKLEVDAFLNDLSRANYQTTSEVVQRRKECFAERMKHARRCMDWYDDQHAEWMAGLDNKRQQRFDEIVKRLRDMGWDKELDYLGEDGLEDMASLPVVAQSSKLTPKTWENVLAAAKGFLENTRRQRLGEERTKVIRPRLLGLEEALLAHYVQLPRVSIMDCRPDCVDLAMLDECRVVADAPISETITREDFAEILPDIAARWEEKRKKEHREAIRKCIGSLPNDVEPLALAIAVFPCVKCNRGTQPVASYHWPDILAHPCGRQDGDSWMFYHSGEANWEKAVYNKAVCGSVADDSLRYPFALRNMYVTDGILQRAVKNMRNIVEALGLDPQHATVDDLRKCQGRVRCVQCSQDHDEMEDHQDKVYAWEAAFVHAWSENTLVEHNQWESVGPGDMQRVTKLEKRAHAEFPSLWTPGSIWACSLCVDWDGKGNDVASHMLSKHKLKYLDAFVTDGTVYLHPGKSVAVIRPPIVLPY